MKEIEDEEKDDTTISIKKWRSLPLDRQKENYA